MVLAVYAIILTGLSIWIKTLLLLLLCVYTCFEVLKLQQYWPKSLIALSLPSSSQHFWQTLYKNGEQHRAVLLASTRVTAKMIILHFRIPSRKMRVYQIILPSMIGKAHFHDLLVYLKTHSY